MHNKKTRVPAKQQKRSYPVHNKWRKTKVLEGDIAIRGYMPETRLFHAKSLRTMLDKYGMVYVKPVVGSLGHGVMKVEKLTAKRERRVRYAFQLEERRREFAGYKEALQALMRETGGRPYLVQKGIKLLKYKGRPFDIRLMVQRTPKGGWEATGTVGRAAHPRKIVTNGSQGGTIYPTTYLLKPHGAPKEVAAALKRMEAVGLNTVRRLHKAYPVIREIGIDYGVDAELKPWILEVNTSPDPCPFALLKDESILRKIVRYGKSYGRRYRLRCLKAKRGL